MVVAATPLLDIASVKDEAQPPAPRMVVKFRRRVAPDEMMQEDAEGLTGAEEIDPVELRLAVVSPDRTSLWPHAIETICSLAVDGNDCRGRWFGEYLDAFAACGRGENNAGSLLEYYGVPLLLTTGDGFFALTSADQVVAALQQQIDGMRAAAYQRSEILDSQVTALNSVSALYRATFSRQKSDGSEISRLTATYLVTDGAAGRRISVLAVHG